MSQHVSCHMTTYAKKEERKFANLTVEITHCVHEGSNASTWAPEANSYNRMKFRSYEEDIDVTFYMQAEHLKAIHAALGDFLEKLPQLEDRGDRPRSGEDVHKRSEDFAVKYVAPSEEAEKAAVEN